MHEEVRLGYLQAMGITVWQPRQALANAADLPLLPLDVSPAPGGEAVEAVREEAEQVEQAPSSPSEVLVQRDPVTQAGHAPPLAPPPSQTQRQTDTDTDTDTEPQAVALAPFYLQLWLAGPVALLVEIDEPGLEKATAPYRLLVDILRAAELPDKPVLFSDFQWPLTRNPQFDRSAAAASQALAAFVQARLEEQSVLSLGCFGERCGLLAETDQSLASELVGREIALDGLPPAWLGASLETLLREPSEKARLWKLLKRVMPRWMNQE